MDVKRISEIREGKIFIYPTDTIYGIGCDAENVLAVEKIRTIKGRDNKPFSVIAPSLKWIKDNLVVDIDLKKFLPGPYTVVLKKKKREFLSHVSELPTLGVRIPKCEFTKLVQQVGVPFITTSVNFSGQKPVIAADEIPKEIRKQVDVVIEGDGECSGVPSALIIDGKEMRRD